MSVMLFIYDQIQLWDYILSVQFNSLDLKFTLFHERLWLLAQQCVTKMEKIQIE